MPASQRIAPWKSVEDLTWLWNQIERIWGKLNQSPDDSCVPCKRSTLPQINRYKKSRGVSLLRVAWATSHKQTLVQGEQLTRQCETPRCGNLGHYTRKSEEVMALREEWHSGKYQTIRELHRGYGEAHGKHYSSVREFVQRVSYKELPDTPSERKRRDNGELPNKESQKEFHTTGRVIYIPTDTAYQNIRAAEVDTGQDRQAIAKSLNAGKGDWKYEDGEYAPSLAILWDTVDEYSGLSIRGSGFVYLSGRPNQKTQD